MTTDLAPTVATGVNGQNLDINYSSTGDTSAAHVGSYAITAVLSNGSGMASDYAVALTNGTLIVTRAVLTVTADGATKVYGAPLPVLTARITGFVNGDTSSVVSGAPSLTTAATAASSAGLYSIDLGAGNLTAANYDFPEANLFGNRLTITPAPLTIAAVSQTIAPGQPLPP